VTDDDAVVALSDAQAMSGYSRSGLYRLIDEEVLLPGRTSEGRAGVTRVSLMNLLSAPPKGKRPRPSPLGVAEAGDFRAAFSLLLDVREAETLAREADLRADRHRRKERRWRQKAEEHRLTASRRMDALLINLITPDGPPEV
jgi:hypothetical protein